MRQYELVTLRSEQVLRVEVVVNVLPRTFHFAALLWASHESCCEQVRGLQEWATPGDLVYGRTTHQKAMVVEMEMEMDSHGGLEVTIRQTESKKKTTQRLRGTDL